MTKNFEALKRDFDTCQLPSPNDPFTIRTLSRIALEISKGEATLAEFEDYLTNNRMGRTPLEDRAVPEFGDACYAFVSNVLNFLDSHQE